MLMFVRAYLEDLCNDGQESIKWRTPDVMEIKVAQQ